MLVIYVNSRLNRRRGREGRELLPTAASSLPFSLLLRLSQELSHAIQENRIPNKTYPVNI
jgi:hypothetical protein